MTNDMVLQDLAGSESSLVERAEIEAKQSEQMDDEQELQSQANDLGEAATTSEDAGDLDAVTSTLIDHPHLSLDTDETKKEEAAEVVEKDEGKKPGLLVTLVLLTSPTLSAKQPNSQMMRTATRRPSLRRQSNVNRKWRRPPRRICMRTKKL